MKQRGFHFIGFGNFIQIQFQTYFGMKFMILKIDMPLNVVP